MQSLRDYTRSYVVFCTEWCPVLAGMLCNRQCWEAKKPFSQAKCELHRLVLRQPPDQAAAA